MASEMTAALLKMKLPKTFGRAFFPATDRVVFLNKKSLVAQYDYPGEKCEHERPRLSKNPIDKIIKDVPVLFVVEPQPANMPEGWEMIVAVAVSKKGDYEDPHILFRNPAQHALQEADPRPSDEAEELPEGWTSEKDPDGDPFFFDHNTNMATYDDPRVVQNPQSANNLTQFVQARLAAKSSKSSLLVSRADSQKVKAWFIGARDLAKFEAIDNHLIDVADIPEPVRNKQHNRYMDILPNPKTRVPLSEIDGDPTSSYYNANYVRGYDGTPNRYVAAMGPLPACVNHFWRMIWESNTTTIVMATGTIEKGKTKCERYWPAEVDGKTTMTFGDISVVSVQEAPAKGYLYTMLKATRGDETRKIGHFWYNTWPDHGVPKSADNTLYPDSVLGMLHTVHKWGSDKGPGHPVLVHCSAGIGRTGTILAIDHAREILKEKKRVDVLAIIAAIRNDRCALVQHPQQFEFVHEACIKYAELHKAHFTVEDSEAPPVAPRPLVENADGRKQEKEAAFQRFQESKRRGGRQAVLTRAQVHGELRIKPDFNVSTAADIDKMWQLLDLDGDGKIGVREARANGMDPDTFARIDSNGDGILSMEEFKGYYRELHKMA